MEGGTARLGLEQRREKYLKVLGVHNGNKYRSAITVWTLLIRGQERTSSERRVPNQVAQSGHRRSSVKPIPTERNPRFAPVCFPQFPELELHDMYRGCKTVSNCIIDPFIFRLCTLVTL
jgi:hypothetical protein